MTSAYYADQRSIGGSGWPAGQHSRPSLTKVMLRYLSPLHSLIYRLSSGWIGNTVRGGPVLLLTTKGRRTGQMRRHPICYLPTDDGIVLVASAAGQAQHPAWYLNLRSHPRVAVQIGNTVQEMEAHTVEGIERHHLWERLEGHYPVLADYQGKTRRQLPIVRLREVTAMELAAGQAR